MMMFQRNKNNFPTVEVLGFGQLTLGEIDNHLSYCLDLDDLEANVERAEDIMAFRQRELEIARGKMEGTSAYHQAVQRKLIAQAQLDLARAEVAVEWAKAKLEKTLTTKFNLWLGRNKLARA